MFYELINLQTLLKSPIEKLISMGKHLTFLYFVNNYISNFL